MGVVMVWKTLQGWVENDGVERGRSARPQAEFLGEGLVERKSCGEFRSVRTFTIKAKY